MDDRREMDTRHKFRRIAPLLLGLGLGITDHAVEASQLSVAISNGRLSVTAQEVPLVTLLGQISRLSGIRIRLDEAAKSQSAQELTTIAFAAVPLEDALGRVLRGRDVIVAYSRGGGIEEVRVYGTRAQHRLSPSSNAPVVRGVLESDPINRVVDTRLRAADAREADDRARVTQLRSDVMSHPEPRRRLSALERLTASADQQVIIDALAQVMEKESDRAVLDRALDIVADHDSIPLEPLLKLAMSKQPPSVRIKALKRLSEQGGKDPRVLETLRTLLHDPTVGIRNTAQRLLDGRPRLRLGPRS